MITAVFEPLLVVAVFALLPLYGHYILRARQGGDRVVRLGAGLALALAVPWLIAGAPREARWLVALASLLASLRLAEVAFACYPDQRLQRSLGRFLFYFFNAADARWIDVPAERCAVRRAGRRRVLRGTVKWAAAAGLVALSTALPGMHRHLAPHLFWLLWLSYVLVSGSFDVATGCWMQTGIALEEVFIAPPLADSPRDFWSRRWNMTFRNAMHRLVFVPLGGQRRPLRSVSAVFLLSAAVHEYLVVAALGYSQGHMTAFFVLHGAATLVTDSFSQRRQRRPLMPRPLAIAAHLTWLTASSWLFFRPLLQVFPAHRWRLW